MVFENLLNPVFSPLLKLPTLLAVTLLSFLVSLMVTLIYKYTTDQSLMKQLKDEMKGYQKQIKELRKEPEKAMQVQKKAMQTNMKYMMNSMKSTLFSFLPIIIIFSWMNANFAYEPINPEKDFTATVTFADNAQGIIELSVPEGIKINGNGTQEIKNGMAKWVLNGKEGNYLLEYKFDGKTYAHEVLITKKNEYINPVKKIADANIKTIEIEHKAKKLLPLFRWKIGWLGTYIIFSIIFSIVVRKIIKVY
ncbi:DUF106 domain-containing protein [Candidatus Woesearchaeota archaeon]|nr:DUF106 domain-containing protein [Candidatus Woesearchaeota archaeon]